MTKYFYFSHKLKKNKRNSAIDQCLIAAEDLLFEGKTYFVNFPLTIPEINTGKENNWFRFLWLL